MCHLPSAPNIAPATTSSSTIFWAETPWSAIEPWIQDNLTMKSWSWIQHLETFLVWYSRQFDVQNDNARITALPRNSHPPTSPNSAPAHTMDGSKSKHLPTSPNCACHHMSKLTTAGQTSWSNLQIDQCHQKRRQLRLFQAQHCRENLEQKIQSITAKVF